jgi:hypothetical protein
MELMVPLSIVDLASGDDSPRRTRCSGVSGEKWTSLRNLTYRHQRRTEEVYYLTLLYIFIFLQFQILGVQLPG